MLGWRSLLRMAASTWKSRSACWLASLRTLAATGVCFHDARYTSPNEPPPMRSSNVMSDHLTCPFEESM